jgi:RNA polymerase sigma-70 factor (ECF subfamily)
MPAVDSFVWFSDPSMVYEQKEFLKIMMIALSELPSRLALVFILLKVADMRSQEVCEFMDISICNLYVMIHRARKRLEYFLQLKWLF